MYRGGARSLQGDAAELGAVLRGDSAGRGAEDDIVVADLTGCGAQDAAIAEMAFAEWTKVQVQG